jgi:hypothetical protein
MKTLLLLEIVVLIEKDSGGENSGVLRATRRFSILSRDQFTESGGRLLTVAAGELTDVEYRKEVAAEVGLGFEISVQKLVVVPNVPSFAVSAVQENVA